MRQPIIVALLIVAYAQAAGAREPANLDPARFADDIRAFEAWDRQNSPPRDAVLFVGSSSIRMWPTAESFPDLLVINRGFGGSVVADSTHYAERIVLNHHPRTIVFYAGDNDIASGMTPQKVFDDFQAFVALVRERLPETQVIYLPIKPSLARWNNWPQMKEVNALVAELAKTDDHLDYVDTATPMLDEDGQPRKELFLDDGLHMNEKGYAVWIEKLRPVLEGLQGGQSDEDDFTPEIGFESLFNGRGLTGWGYRPTTEGEIQARARWHKSDPNAAAWPIVTESVAFDGEAASSDGRYVARDGRIVVTTPSEGRRIQKLSTTREFPKDFILRLEFRASPNADSGVFIREPQLQCRDYLVAGPYRELKNYRPQEWNEIEVTVTGNVARCTCNGEVLEAALAVPATGPIGLEGDRGQMEYRRIRVRELP